ncbi:MAG: glycosyltransferase family 4 protein, partial [Rhodospirillales bacterium]|nr:glycosyltransferase family 4 protein [Rhodospirillales bacterium]MCW9002453.1 glycosyltransferase family 4 protein [Rhodospirillales bacterium]
TEDWYFLSHRLPAARAARDMGCDVTVITRIGNGRAAIETEGFRVIPLGMERKGKNPFAEIGVISSLVGLYRRERPELVHHVALKPILYGTIAARIARVPKIVNAFAGMGFAFIAESGSGRFFRTILEVAFRFLMRAPNVHLIVQNEDDRAMFHNLEIGSASRTHLIRGSGVDTGRFSSSPEPGGNLVAALVGRMLWDKGVGETVAAARILKQRGNPVRIVLVGTPDPANPRSIPESTLREWHDEGIVEWRGRVEDIPALWAQAHIALLPSYREGLPKSLLEAAACGRPMIAADVPGCRELVKDGENGLLVPVRDAEALADAIAKLADNSALRRELGQAARQTVEGEYSETSVADRITALYRSLLPARTNPS